MPKVSIIVPNYNYVRYLPKRIESIVQQTYTDYEIILLDDCSTDGSQTYLEECAKHPQVSHLIINSQNSGSPFAQWEKGIALAQGEYIWIAESDDYSSVDFLEHSVRVLDENPQVAFTLCGSHIVDENGTLQDRNYDPWPLYANNGNVSIIPSAKYLKGLFYHNTAYNASMIVFRKNIYNLIKEKPYTTMRYCGDWLFWIKMAEQGDVALRQERSNYYRRHSKCVTITAQKEKQLEERLSIYCYLWQQKIFWGIEKCISKGFVYKTIIRSEISQEAKEKTLTKMRETEGITTIDYIIERIAKSLYPHSQH